MKTLLLLATAMLLVTTKLSAQIKNKKTDVVKVYGNCSMCKAKIEKAANQKNISKAVWDENNALAIISYDSTKTTKGIILKKIAAAGYDNESFSAPAAAYRKLPGCCHYDRAKKKLHSLNGGFYNKNSFIY